MNIFATVFTIVPLVFSVPTLAAKSVTYKGIAKVDGKEVYTEKHVVDYDDNGRLLTAVTHYLSPDGKAIADLKSDFRESLTVPAHTVQDFRSGNLQGLRRVDGKIVLFDKDPNKDERNKVVQEKDADNRILVGCQGLNYYLLENLDTLSPDKTLPLRFLIPGKLDYYDFRLKKQRENSDGIIDFEVTIESWFLKLFAPRLEVKYDKNKKRIVWYKGLSNITNEKGETQVVTITYEYESAQKN